MENKKHVGRRQYMRRWRAANKILSNCHSNQTKNKYSDICASPVLQEPLQHSSSSARSVSECSTACSLREIGNVSLNQEDTFSTDESTEFSSDCDTYLSLSEDDSETNVLREDLISWANKHQIRQCALDDLLKVLRSQGHDTLPATARTLLKTARAVDIQNKSGMQYIHLSLSEEIEKVLKRYPCEVISRIHSLEISLNVDGLPLFKSSSLSLWPVLCSIHLEPVVVFPVTLTLGSHRPSDLTFLEDAVEEIKQLLESGLKYDGRIIGVKLRCIVCDAPAKAMVKNTKLFSAYYGCDRCEQKGFWEGRMTYQEVDGLEVRTDHSFRTQTQPEHHNGRTPLTELPIDMVGQFPTDYMHQVCLGVMKKLLTIWTRGEKGRSRQTMISSGQVDVVSARLMALQQCIPSCFARKPRSLRHLERWKATELRQFLVYTGKLVLSGILRQDLYEHFLTLSVAISILLCPSLVSQHVSYAHKLLQYFVAKGRELYGPSFLVYNVHSMLHLASDAKSYGCLDECSAFAFENYMQKLKRMVRSGKSPLVQIVKRIRENQDGTTIQSIQRGNDISSKQPDNCIILEDGKCCEVIDKTENGYLCRVFLQPSPLFMEPCESSIIGAYMCQKNNVLQMIPKEKVSQCKKAIKIDQRQRVVYLTILHNHEK